MIDLENPVQITDIETYLANMLGQIPDSQKVKTRLISNSPGGGSRLGQRSFKAADLRIHLRNHTAHADETSPYILSYFLG